MGVQLTLSREIQQTAEAVANETMQSGCILVLDTANAKVRACVSRPGYDPENISASLNAPDSPLLERAFQCLAVGSSVQAGGGGSGAGGRGEWLCLHLPRLVRGGWPDLPLCGRHSPW